MSQRITVKQLIKDLEILSRLSKRKYYIDGNISGWAVRDTVTNNNITGYLSKRELHDSIWSVIQYLWNESNDRDKLNLSLIEDYAEIELTKFKTAISECKNCAPDGNFIILCNEHNKEKKKLESLLWIREG